jgi:hypothetical protein
MQSETRDRARNEEDQHRRELEDPHGHGHTDGIGKIVAIAPLGRVREAAQEPRLDEERSTSGQGREQNLT